MVSLRQLEANRRNAQKSTGPTSAEGKAAVAQNALKHGLRTNALLIEGEDAQELEDHRQKLLADIAPQNHAEELLADRIISATWRLRRLALAEQHHHNHLADCERNELARTTPYPGEEKDEAETEKVRYGSKQYYKLKSLITATRRQWADQQICPAGLTLAVDLQSEANTIDRYSRYEKRLESTIHRAYRELRLLRLSPSPSQGEGRAEVRSAPEPEAPVPHLRNAPNKPISPPTEVPEETYASAKPLPIEPAPTNPPHPLGNKLKTAADGRGIT